MLILSYCQVPDDEAIDMTPYIVRVDSQNRIIESSSVAHINEWPSEAVGAEEKEKISNTEYEILNNIKAQNPR